MHRHSSLPEAVYHWWRFDRYEIKDNVIRPAPGSSLSPYDPWVGFQQIRNQTNGQPAYMELARLATALKADPATKGRILNVSQESQSQILAWCERHGLLGALLSRWVSVTLAPRPAVQDSKLRRQERYIRLYGTDVGIRRTEGDLDRGRSSILIHPLNDLCIQEETLTKTWANFFPSVPWQDRETFAYPVPYSQAFWELYSEPVSEFLRAARLFAGIVEYLGRSAKAMSGGAPATEEGEALAREQAIESLNVLRKDGSPVVVDEGEGLRQEWASPSLLASFAEMLVIDLFAGRRAQYCECCRFPFTTDAYQARYCSPPCRLRQQKRNLRARIKQARASYMKGQSILQISENLGAAAEMVQGWVAGLTPCQKNVLG